MRIVTAFLVTALLAFPAVAAQGPDDERRPRDDPKGPRACGVDDPAPGCDRPPRDTERRAEGRSDEGRTGNGSSPDERRGDACDSPRQPPGAGGNQTQSPPAPANASLEDAESEDAEDGDAENEEVRDAPVQPDEGSNATAGEVNATADAAEGDATDGSGCPRPACAAPPCRAACRLGDRAACAPVRRALDLPAGSGRHLTYRADPANHSLLEVRIDGQLVLDALTIQSDGPLGVARHGRELRIEGGQVRLEVHDNPVGLIRFKADNATLLLDLPEFAVPLEYAETTRIQYPEGHQGFLNAHNATWVDRAAGTVTLSEFAVFHLSESVRKAQGAPAPELQGDLNQAATQGRLGAKVSVRAPSVAGTMVLESEPVQVVPYDDLNVTVQLPDAGTPGSPLRMVVSAELDEGRTISLDLDPGVLNTTDPRALVLRYFNVNDDGSETEVTFTQADSLADVLDPTDDRDANGTVQPEYWVVSDGDGLHVLVSVPTWSTHVVTLATLGEFVLQPSVLVGIVAGAAGSVMAAAFLLWPRSRRDLL